MKNRRFVSLLVGCYLLGLGVLTGMLIEDIRFDESRSALLSRLENDTSKLHQRLMTMEREMAGGGRAGR